MSDVVPTAQDEKGMCCHKGCPESIDRDKVLCEMHFYMLPPAVRDMILDGRRLRKIEEPWSFGIEEYVETSESELSIALTRLDDAKRNLEGARSNAATQTALREGLELEMSGLLMSLRGAEHRLAEHKLIDVALVAMAEGDTPLERLKSFQKEYLDLERNLEGALADAVTQTALREGLVRERDDLRAQVARLEAGATRLLTDHDPDLLGELTYLVDTHAEALEALAGECVYYLVWRARRALGGEG